jgi:hypothetical protein
MESQSYKNQIAHIREKKKEERKVIKESTKVKRMEPIKKRKQETLNDFVQIKKQKVEPEEPKIPELPKEVWSHHIICYIMHRRSFETSYMVPVGTGYKIVLASSRTLTRLKRTCRLFNEIIRPSVLDEYYHAFKYFAVYPNVYYK